MKVAIFQVGRLQPRSPSNRQVAAPRGQRIVNELRRWWPLYFLLAVWILGMVRMYVGIIYGKVILDE